MKRYHNNSHFTSYAVAATLGAVVGSMGTLWVQRYNKTHQESDNDASKETYEDYPHNFSTDFSSDDSVSTTSIGDGNMEDSLFATENVAIDSEPDYEAKLPVDSDFD